MILNQASYNTLYFIQVWKIASKLVELLESMGVPHYRTNISELHNLRWVASDLGNDYYHHHMYPEARRLTDLLFWDSRYAALKWQMWRSV